MSLWNLSPHFFEVLFLKPVTLKKKKPVTLVYRFFPLLFSGEENLYHTLLPWKESYDQPR